MSKSYQYNWSIWRSESGAEICGTAAKPDRHNFLTFLATAQTFGIEFLALAWDAARGEIGTGGSARIQQALVDTDTSLAFKTYHNRAKAEEDVFRTIINEITILCQPFIRNHANIVQLQAICWNISPEDDKPWPALVFEKSHHGDLHRFIALKGRTLGVQGRLKLCLDIGKAVMDMHLKGIIHGDIKPQNILIFGSSDGEYNARMIDFGYSSRYIKPNERLSLPRSEPWNAPENDGRGNMYTLSQAMLADLFCYGMVCVWLLFEPLLCGAASPDYNLSLGEVELQITATATLHARKAKLQALAHQLLASEAMLGNHSKRALGKLFDSCLSEDPRRRNVESLREFIERLEPSVVISTEVNTGPTIEKCPRDNDFMIEKSIHDFYRTDYRVRLYIASCLLQSHRRSESIRFQAALCYYIGFGITRDEQKAQDVLNNNSEAIRTLQSTVARFTEPRWEPLGQVIKGMTNRGNALSTDFAYIYLEQERLSDAEARLTHESEDLVVVCGDNHTITNVVKLNLARIYAIQGRWEEVGKLELQVMETRKSKLGEDHPNTLTSMANLALTFWKQGRWEEAEKLGLTSDKH